MKAIFRGLLDYVFGCHHRELSWPITMNQRTYKVCCHCGTKFDYSWERMTFKHAKTAKPVLSRLGAVFTAVRIDEKAPVRNATTQTVRWKTAHESVGEPIQSNCQAL